MTTLTSPRPEQRWWLTAFIAGGQIRLCLLVALAVIAMPPENGLGVELCILKNVSGAPCPGCGVTRSGANFFRGDVARAAAFHPLGLILHPILLALCVLSILPSATRRAFALRLLPRQRLLAGLLMAFWIAFFIFGLIRWIAVMAGAMEFPPPVG